MFGNKNGHFHVQSINIRSFRNKLGTLKHHLVETLPDVVCLQETRADYTVKIPGYKLAAQSATQLPNLGTAILVRDGIPSVELKLQSDPSLELSCVELQLSNNKQIKLINLYAQVRFPLNTDILKQHILNQNITTLAIGDFNAKLNIDLHSNTNQNGLILDRLLEEDELYCIIPDKPTRFDPAGWCEPSAIDLGLINANNATSITGTNVWDSIGSDHRPVSFYLGKRFKANKKPTKSTKPNLEKADSQEYKLECTKIRNERGLDTTWLTPVEHNKNAIDNRFAELQLVIAEADKNSIPRKNVPRTGLKPYPPFIVDKIRYKNQLINRKERQREMHLKPEINALGREIKADIEAYDNEKYDEQWRNTIDKSPYAFYRLAKTIMSPDDSPSDCPLRDNNNKPVRTDKEKTAIVKTFYEDVYTTPPGVAQFAGNDRLAERASKIFKDTYGNIKTRITAREFTGKPITAERILDVLKHTKNTAPGEDGIYYWHIKELPTDILEVLADAYGAARQCCYFPNQFKKGVTILIPKPGKDHSKPGGYRPITLLPIMGKTFERLVKEDLSEYLEINNKLPESQAGFRPKQSTQDQLLKLTQDATKSLRSSRRSTLTTMFDIEKAFDKLYHNGLILKMWMHLQLSYHAIALVQNFLTDRTVRIKIGNELSDPIELKAGCPQGSILSPLLFNMSVSDIPQPEIGSRVNLSQFADDIATWTSANSVKLARIELQSYNDKIMLWCKKWRIKLSSPKTQVILFTREPRLHDDENYQTVGTQKISGSKTAKFLGVTLDEHLNYKAHQKCITDTIKRKLNLFRAITGTCYRPRIPKEIGLSILKSMICPIATYAPTVTCTRTRTQFKEIDVILARGIKLALHYPNNISSIYARKKANIKPQEETIKTLAYNYVHGKNRSRSFKDYIELTKNKGLGQIQEEYIETISRLTPYETILAYKR